MFNQRVKKPARYIHARASTVHTRTRIQHSMSRLFALGLLLLGSARADDVCSDIIITAGYGDDECPSTCFGQTCDWWVEWGETNEASDGQGSDCSRMETAYSCMCNGCFCGDEPAQTSCDDYDSDPSSCGNYDDTDFTANDMCCACGGGDITTSCQDSTTWHMPNNDGKGCEWVGARGVGNDRTAKRCNKRGADGTKAKRACQATCGTCPGRNNQYGATVA